MSLGQSIAMGTISQRVKSAHSIKRRTWMNHHAWRKVDMVSLGWMKLRVKKKNMMIGAGTFFFFFQRGFDVSR